MSHAIYDVDNNDSQATRKDAAALTSSIPDWHAFRLCRASSAFIFAPRRKNSNEVIGKICVFASVVVIDVPTGVALRWSSVVAFGRPSANRAALVGCAHETEGVKGPFHVAPVGVRKSPRRQRGNPKHLPRCDPARQRGASGPESFSGGGGVGVAGNGVDCVIILLHCGSLVCSAGLPRKITMRLILPTVKHWSRKIDRDDVRSCRGATACNPDLA